MDIRVGVDPSSQAYRITFSISSETWVVVPEIVVMKPGLCVVPLARQS
jgi:hypothetical protein